MVFRNQDLGLHVLIDIGVLLFLLDHFIICSLVCEGWGSTNETAAWRWEGQRSKVTCIESPLLSGSLSPPHLLFLSFPLHHDLMSPFLVRIPLEIPVVGTSETISPATCVISETDNYVTFVCEQSKAKIIYKKVFA